jgi:hypothetical protein
MKTNNTAGRNYVITIGVYMLAKTILNMILGGGFAVNDLIFALAAAAVMYTGLQFVNIAVAVLMAITVVRHLPYNISNLPSTLIYLIEAVIDAWAVIVLLTNSAVKAHFANKWSKLSELFEK